MKYSIELWQQSSDVELTEVASHVAFARVPRVDPLDRIQRVQYQLRLVL